MNDKTKKFLGIALGALMISALAVFGYFYADEIFLIITQQSARDEFVNFVRDSGISGMCAFLGLQILQVVVAIIPGEPVELIGGALYGTWWGLIVCMLGLCIGSVAVYYTIKFFGAQTTSKTQEHLKKYRFLNDATRVHTLMFLLCFIPGTPKDVLLYIAPFLPIKPSAFFLISLVARIPSVITSTYAGANLATGNWKISLIVFGITGIVSLICILNQQRIMAYFRKRHDIRKSSK